MRYEFLNLQFFWQETIENVKKCKSFLSTLIKLASSGKQSTETAASVRELVKDLLVSEPYKQEAQCFKTGNKIFLIALGISSNVLIHLHISQFQKKFERFSQN